MLSIVEVLTATSAGFVTEPVAGAKLVFGGIEGDRHFGAVRASCARTPWHARGTPIFNTRQISIVAIEECREIARHLGVDHIEPRWIGANLVLEGDADLTGLPPATRLIFPSGATLFITEENRPCRHPGKVLADIFGAPQLELGFVRAAQGRRGLVALVEREGEIAPGDPVKIIRPQARRLAANPGPEAHG